MTFIDYVQLVFMVFVIIPVFFLIITYILTLIISFDYGKVGRLFSKLTRGADKPLVHEKVSLD